MSVLGTLRQDIADVLAEDTDFPTLSFIPGRIVPPLYIVSQGSPYITSGNTFGTFEATFSVEVISATASNDTNTEAIDTMIEEALVSLVNQGLSVTSATQPYQLDTNNAQYLASTIAVTKTVKL